MNNTAYIGRFAPSPTGPLHFGSLISALASYLHAHQHNGQWLVRMEDLDPPREQPGAADSILHSLQVHGLQWHGEVFYQSQRLDAYRAQLDELMSRQQVYRCNCNRKKIQAAGGIYDNHCRNRHIESPPFALRVKVDTQCIHFVDLIQGPQQQDVEHEVGDFTLQRKDGLFAYQLAVVMDDIEQNISHIIRGSDLLCSSARQLYLFDVLGAAPPKFGHCPVATHTCGQKLSKQNHAPALVDNDATNNLWRALHFLQLQPPEELLGEDVKKQLNWAISYANLNAIPQQMGIVI
jgi:glutamyl-Q tRNA(Asp) synthetase